MDTDRPKTRKSTRKALVSKSTNDNLGNKLNTSGQRNLNKLNDRKMDCDGESTNSSTRRTLRPRTDPKPRRELRSNSNDTSVPELKFNRSDGLEDETIDETPDNDTISNDENQQVDNANEATILNDKLNYAYDKPVLRKRKHEESSAEKVEEPQFKRRKSENEEVYVFFEVQLSGFKPIDEIVKLCAFVDPLSPEVVCNYIYPKKKLIVKDMIATTKLEITRNLMIDNGQMVNYITDLSIVLNKFVSLIESLKSDNVILVYENQFNLDNIPNILINSLRKYDLYYRVQDKLVGFLDCTDLFFHLKEDGRNRRMFVLEKRVKEAGLKNLFKREEPLYRLDLLSNYFQTRVASVSKHLDEHLITLEAVELKADKDVNYFMRKKDEEDEKKQDEKESYEKSLGTMDDILKEVEWVNSSKDYLTRLEKRNLYLMQKLKHQFINSRTYNQFLKSPKDQPKKKKNDLDKSKLNNRVNEDVAPKETKEIKEIKETS